MIVVGVSNWRGYDQRRSEGLLEQCRVPDDGERNIFRAWSRRSRLKQSVITDSKRTRLRSAKDVIEWMRTWSLKHDRLKETAGAVVDGRVKFHLDSDQPGSKLIVISESPLDTNSWYQQEIQSLLNLINLQHTTLQTGSSKSAPMHSSESDPNWLFGMRDWVFRLLVEYLQRNPC